MKNPFATKKGLPIKGKENEFLNWVKEQEQKKIDAMTPKEREKYNKEIESMKFKMS